MNKLQYRLKLLWLLTIYFVYRIIRAYLENNSDEVILWTLFLIVYIISLIVMLIVIKTWQKRAEME